MIINYNDNEDEDSPGGLVGGDDSNDDHVNGSGDIDDNCGGDVGDNYDGGNI